MPIDILINGKKEHSHAYTIGELVEHLGLPQASLVIELNQVIIKQDMWRETRLKDNDQLELLNFVGGG